MSLTALECCVCYESTSEDVFVSQLPCLHHVCMGCMQRLPQPTCPMCRKAFKQSIIRQGNTRQARRSSNISLGLRGQVSDETLIRYAHIRNYDDVREFVNEARETFENNLAQLANDNTVARLCTTYTSFMHWNKIEEATHTEQSVHTASHLNWKPRSLVNSSSSKTILKID